MPEIQKVHYHHDAMIDLIISDPTVTQREIARYFGKTEAWISIIFNSDAFKERLAERKAELVDPFLAASIEQRLETVAQMALDRLMKRMEENRPMKDSDLIATAKLGIGNRADKPIQPATQNNLYVVSLPPPAPTAKDWLSTRSTPGGVSSMVESSPGVYSPPQE